MAKKLWGGRFKKEPNAEFFIFQKSIQYDHRLAAYDIYHSMIHVAALAYTKVLSTQEANKLEAELAKILKQIKTGSFTYDPASEDIHTEIQNRLENKLGVIALKLHSFRSRNDQVVFDEKYYCLSQALKISKLLVGVFHALGQKAEEYKDDFFIGYTHTRRAQVITFSNYLLSFAWMFQRDLKRLDNFTKSIEVPIGSGALAGSYIRREDYTKAIKSFVKKYAKDFPFKIAPVHNSLDNVSDRDFIIEFLNALSILQMHISRMAEDLILYSTREFNYIDLPEEFCTGSSLMPHKKNPDFLELVRGCTGKIYGNLVSVMTLMKGLPLTYNRDMQLDKEPLFSSVDTIEDQLSLLAEFIGGISLKKDVIDKALEDESIYATELAEYLVGKGVPFRKAHEIVGKLIRYAEDKNIKLRDIVDDILVTFSPHLKKSQIVRILNPAFAVASKRSV